MRYSEIKGLNVSAFTLGTAQLGYNYGINNSIGKPSREAAFEILDAAVANGLNCVDTSDDYGDSEVVIGEWIKARGRNQVKYLTTKASTPSIDHSSLDALRKSMRACVESSKKRLNVEQIPVLMLHAYNDYADDRDNMRKVFEELKASGDILYSGISAYSFHDYSVLAESGFDAVQIPQNIFDWKQIVNGGIQKIADAGMMIFVRSVYLQGLVFKDPDQLDPRMDFCREPLLKFRGFCKEYGLNPAELCMSFLLSIPGVTSLVLGCETNQQVADNAALINNTRVFTKAEMDEFHAAFAEMDPRVTNPGMWFNNKGNDGGQKKA